MELVPTLPSRYYRDASVWEIERHHIFAKAWVMVGVDNQLRRPGDYFTEQVAGWEIFVQRAEDGSLRSFQNVCPHRGGPIVPAGAGNVTELVCRCHGWTFHGDGTLVDARVAQLNHGRLQNVRAESWRQFVFVCLDPEAPSLIDWLGTFDAEWEAWPTSTYRFHSRTTRRAGMNWKVYNDNFLEGYHLPILHPELSKSVRALEFVVETKGDRRWNIQTAPPRAADVWSGVWGYFFPCFSFDVFPGGMAVERWLPVGKDRTDLIFEYFFADDATAVDETIAACEEVATEDVNVCEMVYQNLSAGHFENGWLSPKHERALVEFHELIREVVDSRLAPREAAGTSLRPGIEPTVR